VFRGHNAFATLSQRNCAPAKRILSFPCPIWDAAVTIQSVNSLTDPQLLRDYTERRSEAAFAERRRRRDESLTE
jgi:hypothetical protein